MNDRTVLVTGGAGYIGSHAALGLLDNGQRVVVLDNLSTGCLEAIPEAAEFIEGDVTDVALVKSIIGDWDIDAVMHFAGSVVVPESVADPIKYYRNNTVGSLALLQACTESGLMRLIFSSTAAVYGSDVLPPVSEDAVPSPCSPYGHSKLMTEWMLRDLTSAYPGFQYVALRYFNVAGADLQGRAGQRSPDATHLIKVASEAALGLREKILVFGDDYDTPDGTCIRDYIHVTDLVHAHLLALAHLRAGGDSQVLNCGYGHGYSVLEVLDAVRLNGGENLVIEKAPRRPGDVPVLVADVARIKELFGWRPQHDDLDEIVRSAIDWERKLLKQRG